MPARQRPNGKLWTAYVDGTMSADDRQRMLRSLSEVGEGERGLISNARCLTEGIDVPTLDGVAFIDPKRSEIDIAQAVGRAIRLADGKTIGTIVIPVFIDADEPNPDAILDDSAFKPVWDVLLALRSHDEELAQQLDDLRRMLGRPRRGSSGGPLRLPPKVHVDIPDVCGVEFARAFDVRIIEQTTASREEWFELLEQYVEANHHARVPQNYTVDGLRLGWWITELRRGYRQGTLDADFQYRLEKLPGWSWDPKTDQWEQNFHQLEQEDNACVSKPHPLYEWVRVLRVSHTKGTLDPERVCRLEKLPGWVWNVVDAKWERSFRQLEQEDTACLSPSHPLFPWVHTQRKFYSKGTLDPERASRLEALPGWSWDPQTDRWERNFSQLQKEDLADVRFGHPLYGWVRIGPNTSSTVMVKHPGFDALLISCDRCASRSDRERSP
jgi:hypothetical protein